MRRLLLLASLVLAASCGSDIAGPVQVVDGRWTGSQNGYSLVLNLTQSGSDVGGTAGITGSTGFASGDVSGTFNYPNVNLVITFGSLTPVNYTGVMSQSEARITGQLDGSGFNKLEMDVTLKK